MKYLILIFSVFLMSFTTYSEWKVPASSSKMKNPVSISPDGLSEGKSIWLKECKSCHGTKGLGDGTKAEKIDISCGDFSSEKFQNQTDGDIFYKITEGREPMPSFKKRIDKEDVWLVINYIRTLKK